eukprot:UN33068
MYHKTSAESSFIYFSLIVKAFSIIVTIHHQDAYSIPLDNGWFVYYVNKLMLIVLRFCEITFRVIILTYLAWFIQPMYAYISTALELAFDIWLEVQYGQTIISPHKKDALEETLREKDSWLSSITESWYSMTLEKVYNGMLNFLVLDCKSFVLHETNLSARSASRARPTVTSNTTLSFPHICMMGIVFRFMTQIVYTTALIETDHIN